MKTLRTCACCKTTGKTGAQFKLRIAKDVFNVHRFCGEQLIAGAPEETKPHLSLVHWTVARDEVKAQKAERESAQVQNFWAEKFAQAQERRSSKQSGAATT